MDVHARVALNRLYADYAEEPALAHMAPGTCGVVPGVGPVRPRLMFVGEAPGRNENKHRRPFVGASGKMLDDLLASVGLDRDVIFITNAVKYWPHDNAGHNRTPTDEEVHASLPYLRREHRILGSVPIVVLGKTALRATARINPKFLQLGAPELGMRRGEWSHVLGTPMLPLYHPAYGIYQQANKPLLFKMFQRVRDVL